MNRKLIFLGFLLVLASCQKKELIRKYPAPSFTRSPEQIHIITSDIDLFWKMYDKEIPLFTTDELKEEYIEAGTPALSLFFKEQLHSSGAYTRLLNSWIDRQYYEDVRTQTLQVDHSKDEILWAFKVFQKLYPQAVFTNLHFVVGPLTTGGVVLSNGQIVIAAEMFAKKTNTKISYLSPWLQSVLRTPNYLPVIALHELVHLQQRQYALKMGIPIGGRTLLDRALLEGSADFITHLVLGKFLNDRLLSYADPIETKLWDTFRKTMNKRDFSKWLYNGNSETQKPADLGYYIGYKITKAFYEKAHDKKQAVQDILHMKTGLSFLKKSGYVSTFH